MLFFAGIVCAAVLILFLIIINLYMRTLEVNDQSNRHIFITGCDTGFGYLLARTLDTKGVNVIAGCLTEKGTHDVKQVTSSRLKTVIVDVTDKESVKKAFERTEQLVGERGLWGLVNNAGIMQNFCPAEWTTIEDFEAESKVNLFGTVSVTLTFLPLLRKSRGRLVNVCSVVANWGYPGLSNYVVSKAGVKIFTTCLRRELLNSGVTAHTIEPGGYNTNIANRDKFLAIMKKAYLKADPEKKVYYGGNISSYLIMTIKLFGIFINKKPQNVADSMVHALLAKYPKMAYSVGLDAVLVFGFLSWLPEWLVDKLIGWPAPYGKLCSELEDLSTKES
ncbi:retinol dehydrogenase 7-like [Mercenaria mercenaria]|uniref:retinol dehydrogenase 7-like n=1 Tax=Mercenaria mercenaria TaxID=6596 RepID=UPI00234EE93C|nr:retinol dehydrogenase 7-like [Mercenaria mercenaria]